MMTTKDKKLNATLKKKLFTEVQVNMKKKNKCFKGIFESINFGDSW